MPTDPAHLSTTLSIPVICVQNLSEYRHPPAKDGGRVGARFLDVASKLSRGPRSVWRDLELYHCRQEPATSTCANNITSGNASSAMLM